MIVKRIGAVAAASVLGLGAVAALAGPAFADEVESTSPADVQQAVGMPASGTCDAVTDTSLDWGDVPSGGWVASWGDWLNNGAGGAACVRTLTYNEASSLWELAA